MTEQEVWINFSIDLGSKICDILNSFRNLACHFYHILEAFLLIERSESISHWNYSLGYVLAIELGWVNRIIFRIYLLISLVNNLAFLIHSFIICRMHWVHLINSLNISIHQLSSPNIGDLTSTKPNASWKT